MPAEPTPRTNPARLGVLLAIGVGGAIGGAARYGVLSTLPVTAGGFPWATWLVNVTGSLALGLAVTLLAERRSRTRHVRSFVAIGLCGGYTTWSTFMMDTTLLVRDGHAVRGAWYVAVTLAGGLAATIVGMAVARTWRRREQPIA
jgi:CrcB protein